MKPHFRLLAIPKNNEVDLLVSRWECGGRASPLIGLLARIHRSESRLVFLCATAARTLLVSETATRLGSTCNQVFQSLEGGSSALAPTTTVPTRQVLDYREPPESAADNLFVTVEAIWIRPLVESDLLPVHDQHTG